MHHPFVWGQALLHIGLCLYWIFHKLNLPRRRPWNVDAGDVELIGGDVDGVKIEAGGAVSWSGVRDLSGVSPLCNEVEN